MTTDAELLRSYASDHSETAFTELVQRYIDLVYSAASRETHGDQTLAEDITQAVFTELARKANNLESHPALSGWLYTCVRRMTANVRRANERRQIREQEACDMDQLLSSGSSNSIWVQIRPVLDDAMHELSEPDRTAVVLRFFEERSLKEVGIALGLSENAAHMRVDRALEKLRKLLAKRGVTSTASGLVAVLATGAVLSAPNGLAAKTIAGTLATTAAASSTIGILTLMTSAKLATILGAAAILLIVGAVITSHTAASSKDSTPRADGVLRETASRTIHRIPMTDVAATSDQSDLNLAAALRKVRDVLDNPRPGTNERNPAMVAAIAALGDHRRAAVSMLRESLKNPDPKVRRQAAEGLALIGPEAKEAIPDLMEMLRTSDRIPQAGDSLRALKEIGASSEILPSLADILKENPASRRRIAESVPEMFSSDSSAVDQAFRPLLQNSDLDVRRAAAYTLALVLGNQAGRDVIGVALDALRSSSEDLSRNTLVADDQLARARNLLDQNLLSEALGTLSKAGADPNDPWERVTAASLGSAANEATAVLAGIAMRSADKGLQETALRLLDELNPDVQKLNPTVADLLQSYRQINGFVQRANNDTVTVPELIGVLQQSPQEATFVASARALGRLGPAAQASLPVLREDLAALEPKDGAATPIDIFRIRKALANAIQGIDPQEPKPLFTISDIILVRGIVFDDPILQSDGARRERISAAVQPIFSSGPGRGMELTPDQMRQLLTTLKNVDQQTYDAVFSQVKKIDPQFVVN
jgi:RNA polymerase sigma factor (sigma-70 family)